MASASGQGLIGHQYGVERLIEAWQPERFQKRQEQTVFDTGRLAVIYIHMDHRKRSFLEQPQWQTVPWHKDPEGKPLFSRLCDRLCLLPGLLEDMERLQHGENCPSGFVPSLCQNIHAQLHELYVWRAAWEAENGACCVSIKNNNPEVPFSTVLQFNNLLQAFEVGLYDTILLTLFRMGRILMGPNFSPLSSVPATPSRTNITLLRPADPKTVQDIAREILRIVEYAMLEQHRNAGSFQFLFPLRASLEVFMPGCAE